MEIGKKLRTARENAGLTQIDLANKMGVSSRSIQNYEKDEGGISLDTLEKISNILNVSIMYFVQHQEDTSNLKVSSTNTKMSSTCPAPTQNNQREIDDNDLVEIPYYRDVYAAAGSGVENYDTDIVITKFSRSFLLGHLAVKVFVGLEMINIEGDSMEPNYQDGDTALIVKNQPLKDGVVYVVKYYGELLIKRVQYIPEDKTVILKSDNLKYKDRTVKGDAMESLTIIGQVVGSIRKAR